jgi:E3 ubiquitin-protein ligase UBR3
MTMLHDFSAMGAVMRRVMTRALTSTEIYKSLTDCNTETACSSASNNYMAQSKRIYQQALKSLQNPEPPDEYKGWF